VIMYYILLFIAMYFPHEFTDAENVHVIHAVNRPPTNKKSSYHGQ